jgi:dihydrofolate reductase
MAFPSEPAHAPAPPAAAARLALIVAVAANGAIGARNALPWHLPEDLKRFRALTSGHAIVMGRRTWQSIGHPLPNRQNIVVTRDRAFVAPGAEIAHSLDEALARARSPAPVFCIGGAELFRVALPRADVVHITEIARAFDGDTFWPPLDRRVWREVARESHRKPGGDGFDYAFVTYARVPGSDESDAAGSGASAFAG